MKSLQTYFEGLLDADFDIDDSVLSCDALCKRMKNDLYIKPSGTALNQLPKLINYMQLPGATNFEDDKYSWLNGYPVARALAKWVCTQSKVWIEHYKNGELYISFVNHCLTDAGRKKKWTVDITPLKKSIGPLSGGKYIVIGRKVTINMLLGSKWVEIVRVAIEF